ncbi:MAG: hypothetical protein HRU11_11145 [Parvularculaceae bacterium]|nr:hypothetical protein [Parvularculaceae bacterium]
MMTMANNNYFDPNSPALGIRCIGPCIAVGFTLGSLIGLMMGQFFYGQMIGLLIGTGLGSALSLLIKSRARKGDDQE